MLTTVLDLLGILLGVALVVVTSFLTFGPWGLVIGLGVAMLACLLGSWIYDLRAKAANS